MVRRARMDDWAKVPGVFDGTFEGKSIGAGVTILFVRIEEPGQGPGLHTHPYEEVFVVRAGRARFTVGPEVFEGGPGDVVSVPAGVPHAFETLPGAPFESSDIHLSPEWIQTDL